jgi:hypothetical protein
MVTIPGRKKMTTRVTSDTDISTEKGDHITYVATGEQGQILKWVDDWQPIETAPKDGTRILIASKEGVASASWSCCIHWDPAGDWSDSDEYATPAGHEITHWMPLPEPPND